MAAKPTTTGSSRAASIRSRLRTLDHPWSAALVVVAAAALRLPAVGYGLPFLWHPDEPGNVLVGARMVDHGSLNPHTFIYPSTFYYVIAGFDWLQKLLGWHAGPGIVVQNYGIGRTSDPHLFIALRLVSVLLSVGACLVVWVLCSVVVRRWWAATLAALLLAVSPLMVTNGVFITPDTYSAFFTAIALLMAMTIMRQGYLRDYVVAGVAVGLAAGTKYNAVVVAVAIVAAHFLRYPHRDTFGRRRAKASHLARSVRTWPRTLVPLLLAGLAAVLTFAATTPAAIIDFHEFYSQSTFIARGYATVHIVGTNSSSLLFYINTFADQGVIFVVLAIAGVLAVCGRWWRESLVTMAFVVCYVGLIGVQKAAFIRDLLPVLPALAVLACLGIATITERIPIVVRPTAAVWVICGAVIAIGLVQPVSASLRVPRQLDQHANVEAEAWINNHIPKGSVVVEESYGPWLPLGYHVREVFLLATLAGHLPRMARVIVVTERASGRFLADPKANRQEIQDYRRITHGYCLGASFAGGPWVHLLVPCAAVSRSVH